MNNWLVRLEVPFLQMKVPQPWHFVPPDRSGREHMGNSGNGTVEVELELKGWSSCAFRSVLYHVPCVLHYFWWCMILFDIWCMMIYDVWWWWWWWWCLMFDIWCLMFDVFWWWWLMFDVWWYDDDDDEWWWLLLNYICKMLEPFLVIISHFIQFVSPRSGAYYSRDFACQDFRQRGWEVALIRFDALTYWCMEPPKTHGWKRKKSPIWKRKSSS